MAEGGNEAGDLWSLAGLVTPMALRVAATLRVADHIAAGARTAAALAEAEQLDADVLDRLLRHLVTVGVLSRDDSGRYGLTARGEPLLGDHPSGLRRMLDIEAAIGRADLSFVHLLHSIRTGEPSYPVLFGRGLWDDLAADQARRKSFDEQMGSDVAAWATAIVGAYDWSSLGHVVDVGGGNGTLIAALLHAHPRLRGTVFDLPDTVDAAHRNLQVAGLAERSEVVAGSFFDGLPAGADGYLLSAILHDWDDDGACAILRRCAEAAGTAGRIFIVEKTSADGASPRTVRDLRLLAYLGGRERDASELTALAERAGLEVSAVHPAGNLSLVEATA